MSKWTEEGGGPAFPTMTDGGYAFGGMTLRDYFAAKAMAGLLAHGFPDDAYREILANRSYLMADAMLAERAKGGGA